MAVGLGAILVVGFALRLYGLGAESLWLDEGITVQTVQQPLREMVAGFHYTHPPLHYLILHLWTQLFGTSEFAVRMPSVVFGLATIYLTYRLGATLFDRKTGLIAATLVALSLFQIRYSQEARNYMLMSMLSLFSFLWLLKLNRATARVVDSLGYVVVNTLLLYTHVFGIFVMLSQNLYFLLRKILLGVRSAPSWRLWLGLQAAIAVIYIPWVTVLWGQWTAREADGSWQPTPVLRELAGTFASYGGSIAATIGLAILLLLFVVRLLYRSWDRGSGRSLSIASLLRRAADESLMPFYLLIVWLLGVVAIPYVLSHTMTSFYRPRYTITASIPFYMLVALAILATRKMLVTKIVIGLLLIVYAVDLYDYHSEPNKERWREATRYLETRAHPNDLVIVNSGVLLRTNVGYYSRRDDLTMVAYIDESMVEDEEVPSFDAELERMIAGRDRVWVVISHRDEHTEPLLAKFEEPWRPLEHNRYFSISHVEHRPYLGMEVLLYGR